MATAETPTSRTPGYVCTFYSYKGGVGRSMAVANIAVLLARMNRNVLVVDWDLEAPGLEKYLAPVLQQAERTTRGLIDLIDAYSKGETTDWRKGLLTGRFEPHGRIDLLHAGLNEPAYLDKLRTIDWDKLFREHELGAFLDRMRQEWRAEYDMVLIDSRTGITDIGGICSILMPDCLVCLFTTNYQSLAGVKDTMIRARRVHADLPLDRNRLAVVPIPARDESNTEYRLAAKWRELFARELSEFYTDWIPKNETAERVLDYLKIPYVAFWSFGEELPVLKEQADNPKALAYSYAIIARLLESKLNWAAATASAVEESEAVRREKTEKEAAQRALSEARERQRQNFEEIKNNFLVRCARRLRAYRIITAVNWIWFGFWTLAGILTIVILGIGLALESSRAEFLEKQMIGGSLVLLIYGGLAWWAWRNIQRRRVKRKHIEDAMAAANMDYDRDPALAEGRVRELSIRVFDWPGESIWVRLIELFLGMMARRRSFAKLSIDQRAAMG